MTETPNDDNPGFVAKEPEHSSASSPDVAAATGEYFTSGSPVSSSPADCDPVAAQRLWRICLKMTGEAAAA